MKRVTTLLPDDGLLPDDVQAADVLRQRPPTFAEIIDACATHYGIEHDAMLGISSDRVVTTARNCAFYIGRRYTRHSCEEMAFALGRRTHHPCTTALTKMSGRLQVEARLQDDVDIIERRIAQAVLDWRFNPCR